jgi:hypothetical protein
MTQDGLGDRRRHAWQCRWVELEELGARDVLSPFRRRKLHCSLPSPRQQTRNCGVPVDVSVFVTAVRGGLLP